MPTIESFEDILAWQKARELSKEVDRVTDIGSFRRDFELRDQIREAAGSVMHNIAEGFGRSGNKEFRQYLSQAKASVHEVRSEIHKAFDRTHIDAETYQQLLALQKTTERLIGGFIRYLNQSTRKGGKFSTANSQPPTANGDD